MAQKRHEIIRPVDPDPGSAATPEHRLDQPFAERVTGLRLGISLGECPGLPTVDRPAWLLDGNRDRETSWRSGGDIGQSALREDCRGKPRVQWGSDSAPDQEGVETAS